MKRLLYLFIGVSLVVSCMKEDDMYSDASSNPMVNADPRFKGTYNLSWIVDKQEVDTATLTLDPNDSYSPISHFPMAYFLNLIGKKVNPTDISYQWGMSDWKLMLTVIGYSENNIYLQNATWAPQVWFQLNGEDYSFLIYMNDESNMANWFTSMVYDSTKDMWSGACPVYKFQLINWTTSEQWDRSYPTPINMTFQTTGKKK
ncbi:MAG: hypothetical protein IJ159_05610 [Prevotella sp.]|nr:hypothetical protein [Prevotella sp.]